MTEYTPASDSGVHRTDLRRFYITKGKDALDSNNLELRITAAEGITYFYSNQIIPGTKKMTVKEHRLVRKAEKVLEGLSESEVAATAFKEAGLQRVV